MMKNTAPDQFLVVQLQSLCRTPNQPRGRKWLAQSIMMDFICIRSAFVNQSTRKWGRVSSYVVTWKLHGQSGEKSPEWYLTIGASEPWPGRVSLGHKDTMPHLPQLLCAQTRALTHSARQLTFRTLVAFLCESPISQTADGETRFSDDPRHSRCHSWWVFWVLRSTPVIIGYNLMNSKKLLLRILEFYQRFIKLLDIRVWRKNNDFRSSILDVFAQFS